MAKFLVTQADRIRAAVGDQPPLDSADLLAEDRGSWRQDLIGYLLDRIEEWAALARSSDPRDTLEQAYENERATTARDELERVLKQVVARRP